MFATIIVYQRQQKKEPGEDTRSPSEVPGSFKATAETQVPLHKWFNLKESFYYHFQVFSFTIIHPTNGLVVEATEQTQPAFTDGSYHLTDIMVAV